MIGWVTCGHLERLIAFKNEGEEYKVQVDKQGTKGIWSQQVSGDLKKAWLYPSTNLSMRYHSTNHSGWLWHMPSVVLRKTTLGVCHNHPLWLATPYLLICGLLTHRWMGFIHHVIYPYHMTLCMVHNYTMCDAHVTWASPLWHHHKLETCKLWSTTPSDN